MRLGSFLNISDVAGERVGSDIRDFYEHESTFQSRSVAGEEAELVLADPAHGLVRVLRVLAFDQDLHVPLEFGPL